MSNPFEEIVERLNAIEKSIADLKVHSFKGNHSEIEEELLTIQEAAKFLKLKVPTIYSKVSKEEIPFIKKTKRLYFSKAQLLKYLKDGNTTTKVEIEKAANHYINQKR